MSRPNRLSPSLATVTAIVIATMLLLSVGLAYVGVTWYSSYLDESMTTSMPPQAALAYRSLKEGQSSDGASVRALIDYMNEQDAQADVRIRLSALVCGLISATACAIIGIYLARRIASPLEDLTAAAKTLQSGDFSARVVAPTGSTREVASLVQTFNALAVSLDTMEKRLRFNNMAIAHELRTPLTILQGGLQGMIDGVFALEPRHVSDLLLQVEGLGRIVEDLRTLSLAIGHQLVMQRQMLDMAEVVAAVVAAARPMLEESGLAVETALAPAVIAADPQRVRQAVLALLENVRRYAAGGGRLRCETERLDDGSVVIRILDRGPGFPEDMDAVAVNPFWRGDSSRSRATGGTGLGLSVVKAIALAHNGQLTFSNRPEGGAMVAIRLCPA
ncbi:ATP-binding protein [Rhizobium wuzhouense]|uniref:histidine kinase n=1 Tax=Rhizobium wuzhouense TaxID=1986026 RepID=A0ABX5NNR3_9HYPH|nr:ATP-binding protein [Rhizobium wuzhouense]PYB71823.1 two-component sensor histidine kinase [Rhizobium wuzhouense]